MTVQELIHKLVEIENQHMIVKAHEGYITIGGIRIIETEENRHD